MPIDIKGETMLTSNLRVSLCSATAAIAISLATATSATAETTTVTDIAGRTVEVEKDPSRVVLGEGRLIYALALLDREDPFARIAGWRDDLITADPDAYRKYLAAFPKAETVPRLGSPYSAEWNLETVISLGTELVIMSLGDLAKSQESGVIEKLDAAGIDTVFVDFRENPTENTVPSLQLLGRILDERDNADEFTDFYNEQIHLIDSRVAAIPMEERPVVFIEQAAGYDPDAACCRTFGATNLGRLVDLAGGRNWGSSRISGVGSEVSFESVLTDDPPIIIGTGANWSESNPATTAVLFGYEATPEAVQERLAALAAREGWSDMAAVRSGRFHSVYHQFYNNPYHFVAMQAFAKWIHPELFTDLEPEATMRELHERFLPIGYSGVFWGTLEPTS